MISHISINNFAIIKNTEIDFDRGLNIITGETGAGKSIVIEAISLALGSRADSSYVRTGAGKAVIQLVGTADGEEMIITREISQTGKNLCKLNGEIVTLSQIVTVASKMADIHGQYDNQSLLNPDYHIVLLDAYKQDKTKYLKDQVREIFEKYSKCRSVLPDFFPERKKTNVRKTSTDTNTTKLRRAKLTAGGDKLLQDRISVLQNSEKNIRQPKQAYGSMYEESPSVMEGMNMAVKAVLDISAYSQDIATVSEDFSDIYYRLEDICHELRASGIPSSFRLRNWTKLSPAWI